MFCQKYSRRARVKRRQGHDAEGLARARVGAFEGLSP